MQYFKFSSNQRGPREHRGSREYIPRLLRAGKSRTPPANSKIMALLRDNLIHSWDSSLILIVIPIETITSCLKQTLFYILSLISTSLTSTSFVHVCCGKQRGGKELKNYNEKKPLFGTNPLCNWTFPLHDLWPQNLSINHARGSNRRCSTVTYELMKKTHPAPIFQEHSQRRQEDGQQHINEGIGPSGSDRHFCCATPAWAGEDKKVSCFSKGVRVRERVSLKALKQAVQLGGDLCKSKLQKTAAVCS